MRHHPRLRGQLTDCGGQQFRVGEARPPVAQHANGQADRRTDVDGLHGRGRDVTRLRTLVSVLAVAPDIEAGGFQCVHPLAHPLLWIDLFFRAPRIQRGHVA